MSKPQHFKVLYYHLKGFIIQCVFCNRLCRPCLDFRCGLEQFVTRVSQVKIMFTIFVSVPVCLCRSIHVNLCMRTLVFYLHSKDLIKVSRLTQQLTVNLASFSHSPTHDLSIFLLYQTTSRHVTALKRCAVI